MTQRIIGITGGVGAGKSKVLEYIKNRYSVEILCADEIANHLKKNGNVCYQPIVNLLGQDILNSYGEIDNKKMAQKVFAEESVRIAVNQLIHPAVKNFIRNRLRKLDTDEQVKWIFIEAALLLEDNYNEIVDEIWYIYSDVAIRRDRLMQSRGYTIDKTDAIMKSQLKESVFFEKSDRVIYNNGNFEDTCRQIDHIMEAKNVQND